MYLAKTFFLDTSHADVVSAAWSVFARDKTTKPAPGGLALCTMSLSVQDVPTLLPPVAALDIAA
jgi:hypothetical protein